MSLAAEDFLRAHAKVCAERDGLREALVERQRRIEELERTLAVVYDQATTLDEVSMPTGWTYRAEVTVTDRPAARALGAAGLLELVTRQLADALARKVVGGEPDRRAALPRAWRDARALREDQR